MSINDFDVFCDLGREGFHPVSPLDRVNSLTTWRIEGGSFLLLNMSEGKVRFEKS